MYALVDCNNFYCSCEKLFQPKLDGKPVIVLSNNDGCAIARSDEAKALGIDMGTPAFMVEHLVKKHDLVIFSSNYTLYGDMSDRVMKTLSEFVPQMEIYSIDEAFLDMHDLAGKDLLKLGLHIKATIWRNIGIPVTVGIGATKVLAKMANRHAKKTMKDVGVYWASNETLTNEMMRSTLVGDIWGVGHQYALFLKRHQVNTAYEMKTVSAEWIRKRMTVMGQRLLNELNGVPSIAWDLDPKPRKNICHSRSFGCLMTDRNEIREAMCNYAANIALKLREQKTFAGSLQVFVQTNPHKNDHEQYMRSVIVHLDRPTNLAGAIIKQAVKGFDIVFKDGLKYMKCGITAMNIVPENAGQSSLFDQTDKSKNSVLLKEMDKINKSIGRDVVRMAVQGYERKYRMRADRLSKQYTTDITQLLNVKI
ncbi:MAG: Y-family DNA polymerase [Chitinophagaceae bacterium]